MELASSQNITYDMKAELFEQPVKQYKPVLFLGLLQRQPKKLILDVACGTGGFTQDVLKRNTRIREMDTSVPMT